MKTILYWFSGSGNSLAIARDLATQLGEAELVPLPRAITAASLPPADRVGIVLPVYAFGPPRIVLEFARKAPLPKAVYVFTLATMGGMAGATHAIIGKALKSQGIELAASWSVAMPGNCISLYPAPAEPKQQRLFGKAEARVAEIAKAVRDAERGACGDSWPPASWGARLLYPMAMPHFASGDRKFFATEACNHCGLCARVCPVENIRIVEGRPEWLHRCEQCFGCIHWCPVAAIQAGKVTLKRKRYHHPAVTAKDICLRGDA